MGTIRKVAFAFVFEDRTLGGGVWHHRRDETLAVDDLTATRVNLRWDASETTIDFVQLWFVNAFVRW